MKIRQTFSAFTIFLITCISSYGQITDSTILNVTNQWNKDIENRDTTKLSSLYADTISYYGRLTNKANVLLGKTTFFQKHPDFKQSINGEIEITKISSSQYKASFPKRSSFNGKTIDVKGYLIFSKENGHWKISIENDNISYKNLTKNTIGASIDGDFSGDGTIQKANIKIIKNGVFDEEPFLLSVNFSGGKIKPIQVSCDQDYIILINEGDLNGIAGDEITIYQPPNHGCTYTMSTYAYVSGKWKLMMEPFLIPTACDEISDEDLQKRIFKEGHTVYFYDTDVNNQSFDAPAKFIKRKAKLKQ